MDWWRFGELDPPSWKEICKDVIENYETLLATYYAMWHTLSQLFHKVISQIYQFKKKSITSIKSFSIKHFPQISSNLTTDPLIQITLSSTHNSLKFL